MLVRRPIERWALFISFIILLGVLLIQFQQASRLTWRETAFGVFPVIVTAFAYPLGNRKMIEHCAGQLDAFQRAFGMTIPWVLSYGAEGLLSVSSSFTFAPIFIPSCGLC
ncbi:putative membrane protein [Geobacillus kaustophilus]|uniref:Putative membrane protein n=1 Tax=Geobacillus kaustophilus TaxID=1462 RepID=A0A0D8BXY9_GEOKU|nr:putative membrane protein [Geobacillus kaustophilus]